jgi:hypothetical protein
MADKTPTLAAATKQAKALTNRRRKLAGDIEAFTASLAALDGSQNMAQAEKLRDAVAELSDAGFVGSFAWSPVGNDPWQVVLDLMQECMASTDLERRQDICDELLAGDVNAMTISCWEELRASHKQGSLSHQHQVEAMAHQEYEFEETMQKFGIAPMWR